MIEINLQKLERGLRKEKVKVVRNGKVTYEYRRVGRKEKKQIPEMSDRDIQNTFTKFSGWKPERLPMDIISFSHPKDQIGRISKDINMKSDTGHIISVESKSEYNVNTKKEKYIFTISIGHKNWQRSYGLQKKVNADKIETGAKYITNHLKKLFDLDIKFNPKIVAFEPNLPEEK